MEYEAFVRLLQSRTIVVPDGRCLFKLYNLQMPMSTPSDLIVDYNNIRYLRIDCLRDDDITSSSDHNATPITDNAAL
jgi:hypothetical protein